MDEWNLRGWLGLFFNIYYSFAVDVFLWSFFFLLKTPLRKLVSAQAYG